MTNQEFSYEFDVLYNNIASNQAPGLDEYEKSVFLTKAQTEVVKNYFTQKGNKYNEGLDNSAKRQVDFSKSIVTAFASPHIPRTGESPFLDTRSERFEWDEEDVMFMLNEVAYLDSGREKPAMVIPLHYHEYNRLMCKPYKYPLKGQCWRIINNSGGNTVVELITPPREHIYSYYIRYFKKPNPIILTDLSDIAEGLTIDGYSEIMPCELDPILHPEILQRAVELAKIAYIGDYKDAISIQRSE